MGLPIIAGAALQKRRSSTDGMPSDMGAALLAGTATSAITGWVQFTNVALDQSRGYGGFAIYRCRLHCYGGLDGDN